MQRYDKLTGGACVNQSDISNIRRVIQTLKFENKTHLSRQDIDRIIQELELNRDYRLADYVRSMDPAAVSALLR